MAPRISPMKVRDSDMNPDTLTHFIDELAKNTERSRSWVVNKAVENYIEYNDWFIEKVKEGIADADAGRFASPQEIEATFKKLTRAD